MGQEWSLRQQRVQGCGRDQLQRSNQSCERVRRGMVKCGITRGLAESIVFRDLSETCIKRLPFYLKMLLAKHVLESGLGSTPCG